MRKRRAFRSPALRLAASGLAAAAFAVAAPGSGTAAAADDWPTWRGPSRDGVAREANWNPESLKGGPKVLWRAKVGQGYSSVTVAGGKAVTAGRKGQEDIVSCFDAASGALIWEHRYPAGKVSYPGPRSTVTIEGKRMYHVSVGGSALCLDADTGRPVWTTDMAAQCGAVAPTWGISGSPVALNGKLAFNATRSGVVLDKATGRPVWAGERGKGGYASPVPYRVGDRDMLAIFGAEALFGVHAADGKVAWSFPWKTSYDVNASDPLPFPGGRLFITSGYNRGCAMLDVSGPAPRAIWENKNLSSQFSGCVSVGDAIYGISGNTGKGSLVCLDPATGQVKWSRPVGFGSLVASGDRLIVFTERGSVLVVAAAPDAYRELARADGVLGGTCWTAPTPAGGRLYVRNHEGDLACLDLK